MKIEILFTLYDLSKQCNKSTDCYHSARPLRVPCLHFISEPSVKHYTIFFSVIWRGTPVNCFVPFTIPLSLSVRARSSIHTSTAMFAQAASTQHRLTRFWNHLICHPPLIPRHDTLKCFAFSALSKHPPSLSAEILSSPALCFNSGKQAPTHLSVFPYLQPRCAPQDISTTQAT